MKSKLLSLFRLHEEAEDPLFVIERISKDSVFRGANIWILIFAIFIASLGLNINSTAVIIGAMLISPLMGPIMGIGLGVAINDLHLAKEAVKNYSFAVIIGLITSFIYFSITPLNDAYSELLARTTPTIYDVLIAIFGGLAGIIANTNKHKGNVIPGVAIATALMPPLCTAGYGLATFQLKYFFGAIYLFTINTVFIALATLITIKYLRYPVKHLTDSVSDKRSLRLIWAIISLTVIPSIYFGYEMIQQNKFSHNSNLFIESHLSVEGSYLLNKAIDPQNRRLTLVYGGKDLSEKQIKEINDQLQYFGLKDAVLTIKQGISLLSTKKEDERINQLTNMLNAKNNLIIKQKSIIDSVNNIAAQSDQILKEIRSQIPQIVSVSIRPYLSTSVNNKEYDRIVLIQSENTLSLSVIRKIEEWLKIRLDDRRIIVRQIK